MLASEKQDKENLKVFEAKLNAEIHNIKQEAMMRSNNSQRVRASEYTGPPMIHSHPIAEITTAKTITVRNPAPPIRPRPVQLFPKPEVSFPLFRAGASSTEYLTSAPPRTLRVVAPSTGNRVRRNTEIQDAGH
jgi:hypothetical protein